MSKNTKIVKKLTYLGLGFPIILKNVLFCKVRKEWLPKIDIEKIAKTAFQNLPSKSSRFTGDEIKFIRTYLGKSKTAFAEIFKLSHTAIAKWEKVGQVVAPILPAQEIVLRLYLKDCSNASNREFYKTYKNAESSVYSEDEVPMEIVV